MDQSSHAAPHTAEGSSRAAAAPSDRAAPELDLDRLVWDPEYREAMRLWVASGR